MLVVHSTELELAPPVEDTGRLLEGPWVVEVIVPLEYGVLVALSELESVGSGLELLRPSVADVEDTTEDVGRATDVLEI